METMQRNCSISSLQTSLEREYLEDTIQKKRQKRHPSHKERKIFAQIFTEILAHVRILILHLDKLYANIKKRNDFCSLFKMWIERLTTES